MNKLWLLITADLDKSPVNYNLGNKLGAWQFSSEFQRIFLLELKEMKVFELNLFSNS